jgi:hypothetical protein
VAVHFAVGWYGPAISVARSREIVLPVVSALLLLPVLLACNAIALTTANVAILKQR